MKKALIAAKINVENVIQAFDEMDRNNDNLVRYEEFRYYVSQLKNQDASHLINVQNLVATSIEEERLQVYKVYWDQMAAHGDDKVSKEDAIEVIRENASKTLSPSFVKALQIQMDITQDGWIDFHEFSRACEKIF